MLHWAFDEEASACDGDDQTERRIEDQEVDGVGNEVEVGALREDGHSERTAEPHRDETYMSHGYYVGQVQVRKGLTTSSQAQKHRQADRRVGPRREDERDCQQALRKSHEEENGAHTCSLHLSGRQEH